MRFSVVSRLVGAGALRFGCRALHVGSGLRYAIVIDLIASNGPAPPATGSTLFGLANNVQFPSLTDDRHQTRSPTTKAVAAK
jgi:hypothetical protein